MNQSRFADLLVVDESEDHEFLTKVDKPRIAKTVCAFLNGRGGRIVVGADDDGNVTPLQNLDSAAKQVVEYLQESVLPVAAWSATVERSNADEAILVIDVPAGMTKPYMIAGQIWCRHEDQTVPATPDDVSRLIKDRIRADERWERRVALGVTKEDLDLEEVLRTAEQIQKAGRHKFKKPSDPLVILDELSLFTADRFSNAAVVLFGNRPCAIHPQLAVRLTVYESSKTGSSFVFDESIEFHLFATIHRLVEVISTKVGVSSKFDEGSWQRQDSPVYPLWSLREGILNALIHRDLSSPSASTSIGVFPDHIVISNYGELPKGWRPALLKKDHTSIRRNPDIAQVCFLRGMIEKLGRGTQLIAEEFNRLGLQLPEWHSAGHVVRLNLSSKRKRTVAREELNMRQVALVKQLPRGEEITVTEYMDWWTGDEAITERTARNDLVGLVKGEFLERLGRARSTRYRRTSELT